MTRPTHRRTQTFLSLSLIFYKTPPPDLDPAKFNYFLNCQQFKLSFREMDGIILKAWTHAEEFDARYPVLSNPDWIIAENKPSTRIRFDSDGASGNMEMQR